MLPVLPPVATDDTSILGNYVQCQCSRDARKRDGKPRAYQSRPYRIGEVSVDRPVVISGPARQWVVGRGVVRRDVPLDETGGV